MCYYRQQRSLLLLLASQLLLRSFEIVGYVFQEFGVADLRENWEMRIHLLTTLSTLW
jgi:hypothetical protein